VFAEGMAWLDSLADDVVVYHESHKNMAGCDHERENEGSSEACGKKCGMSLIAHAFLEMP
jgi:hypothetical protein